MPKHISHINLIRSKAKGSAQLAAIERSLRRSAIISLGVFVFLGVVVGGVYFFMSRQLQKADGIRQTLVSQINAAKTKEGLLLSIKDRTQVAGSVISGQRPWAGILDLLTTAVAPALVSNVSASEQNKISVGFSVSSLGDVVAPVAALIRLAHEGRLKHPELTSVQLGTDGTVAITASFVSVF